ncbi:MAG: glycine cleavage system protein GcvH [Acidimicrobiia bacterium]
MNVPDGLRYTSEHEWIQVEGNLARVGITDYAQDALGDVVYVSLPEVDSTVAANATCCEVESTKSVSDVFSPVSGRVVEVNTELNDAPQGVNEAPYGKGWIFVVDMSDPGELDGLMDAGAYQALIEKL